MKTTTRTTQLTPEEILDPERFMEREGFARESEVLSSIISLIRRPNLRVCDVGGASGIFLNEILTRTKYRIRTSNMEVMSYYRKKQVNKRIEFIQESILNNGIPADSFDFVTFRHVLHHLVADNVDDTLANQEQALGTVFRMTKPGGYVIFEEEAISKKAFSVIIYHLSKLANRLKIRWPFLQMAKVVVSFMTADQIDRIVRKYGRKYSLEVIDRRFNLWRTPLAWKFTVLLNNVGSVFYIIRVGKEVKSS